MHTTDSSRLTIFSPIQSSVAILGDLPKPSDGRILNHLLLTFKRISSLLTY